MLTKKRLFFKLIGLNKKEQKAFLFIFFISLVCLSSFLQSNQLYMDDFWRLMEGATYWKENGRPMASWITLLLQSGRPLTDISPLPQILCFVLYSLSIVYVAKLFEINNLVILSLSGLVFVLNPYNLSIYFFTLDSFSMGLGVFCSIASFCLTKIGIEKINQKKYSVLVFLSSIILLIISLSLYQPTSSFYLVSFIFYLLIDLCKEVNLKKSLYHFLIYSSILFLSFLAYIPIKNHYVRGKYTLSYSTLPPVNQIPVTIAKHIIRSWSSIHFQLGDGTIFFLMIGLLILIALTIIFQISENTLKKKNHFTHLIASLLLGIFYYFILISSFIFPTVILAQFPWHTRIFTGFTGVVGIGCLFLAHFWSASKFSFLKYILIFYLSWIVLSFTNLSLTYGNVIHHQNVYEQRVGTLIIADIEETSKQLSLPLDQLKISFANKEQRRGLRRNILNLKALEKYPILYSLAYPYFQGGDFGIHKFKTFGLNFEAPLNRELIDKNKGYYIPTNEPVVSRQLYDIHLEHEHTFVVIFKE